MEQLQGTVRKVLEHIRPSLRRDGEDVAFGDLAPNKVVTIRFTGTCQGGPMSGRPLKEGIKRFVHSEIPSIRAVEAVI